MYGASWPLYFDFPPDLLISTIKVLLCMILTASLDSETNSDPESGRGLDSETASDGGSGLYIPLFDAPHVAPLIIPQWRRPDRRDRGTVLHGVTLPPFRFQPKYILERPKSPITQTPITQSYNPSFQCYQRILWPLDLAIQRNSIHVCAGYEREVIKLFAPRGHPH
jgi:hypothetical protein